MKGIKKILGIAVSLMIVIILMPNICYAKKGNNNLTKSKVVDTFTINCESCNVVVQKHKNSNFKYEYNNKLFEVTTKREKNELMIKVKAKETKENKETNMYEKVIIYIPNNLTYKKVNVQNNKSGIGLCEINAEINIVNNKGATSFYVPQNLSNIITYTSNKGSGSVSFCKGANNYSFNLNKKDSAVSCTLPKYEPNSSTYKHVEGNGSAKINIDVKNSSFAVNVLK